MHVYGNARSPPFPPLPSFRTSDGFVSSGFLDDAIRIERLLASSPSRLGRDIGPDWTASTRGAVAVHINSNEHTDDEARQAVIYFDARWWGGWGGWGGGGGGGGGGALHQQGR